MYKKQISEFLRSNFDNMISDLKALVAIPSVRGEATEGMPFGKNCADALSAILSIAERMGFKTENFENYMGSAIFGEGSPLLGILGHLDVVPAGDGWSHDPFSAEVCDGRIIGRGTIDDKGPVIAALYALYAIKELKIPLRHSVQMLFGTDEENGSSDLAYYMKNHSLPELLFTPDAEYPLINIEKGMLRVTVEATLPDGISVATCSNAINAVPSCACAEISGEKLEMTGVGAHASLPEQGDNALTKLFSILAEKDIAVFGQLAKIFPHGEYDGKSAGVNFADEISGSLTLAFTTAETEKNTFRGGIDIRFPVCTCKQEVIDRLEKALDGSGIKIVSAVGVEPHHVPADSDFIKKLLEAYTEITGNEGYTVAIGGGTYVHETANGVAFGAEFPGEQNNMHGVDEFITLESLLKNAEIFAAAIIKICS